MTTVRFSEALTYAYTIHAAQIRKGSNVPYISHLLAVSALVIENGGTEDQAIAALLHDAVEDQGGLDRADDIARQFGPEVRDMVLACTDAVTEPKPDWHIRKRTYVARLAAKSTAALLVTLADKTHNAQTITDDRARVGEAVWDRFSQPKADTLWYYKALAEGLAKLLPRTLSNRLSVLVKGMIMHA